MNSLMRLSLPLPLLAALAACTVGPDYRQPRVALGASYVTPARIAPADARWWQRFGDPLLDRIVERVDAQNLDIAAAAARIAQARAVARAAHAALLPNASATASSEADSQSLHSPFGAAAHELGFPRGYELAQAGAEAGWEIDLFGRLSRRREAARAELAGSIADSAAVRLSTEAEAVDAYLQLRGLQARLAVAGDQARLRHALVALIRQRFDQGVAAERDWQRATGDAEGVDASIPPLKAAIAGQMNRLDVLMGLPAGSWRAELEPATAIPAAPDPSGDANPAELMRRRPDILAAEHRVAAANARIGAAIAGYYPQISLSAMLGVASVGTSSLLTGDALAAGGGAGLRWRLFDFGQVDAEVAQAKGGEAEALAQYRAAVLRATGEVETALAGLSQGREEIDRLERQTAALTRARDQARAAYEHGAVALLEVLDADRALLEASDRLQQARAGTARASVAAVRALGGGYSES